MIIFEALKIKEQAQRGNYPKQNEITNKLYEELHRQCEINQ